MRIEEVQRAIVTSCNQLRVARKVLHDGLAEHPDSDLLLRAVEDAEAIVTGISDLSEEAALRRMAEGSAWMLRALARHLRRHEHPGLADASEALADRIADEALS